MDGARRNYLHGAACVHALGRAVIDDRDYDVVIVGSGAGGGTVAQELGPLVRGGASVLVVEQGPRLRDDDFSGRELEMASALYEDGGGFLTSDGTMTLAFGRAYGGSTIVTRGRRSSRPNASFDAGTCPTSRTTTSSGGAGSTWRRTAFTS